ncbi:MAG: V-type ATPase subunit [Candidatus Peribacteraceae bacterium]|nr:V-type ATPase subunit [Candidatus Peribacteraceae bacterium]
MSQLASLIGQKFAYAYGRTGVLQQLLLDQSDTDRLLGTHGREEVEKIFTELKFTSKIDQDLTRGESILQALGAWVRREVEQMSPVEQRPVFHILWLSGDMALLSYLLKDFHGLTSAVSEAPEPPMTAYAPAALRALARGEQDESLPSYLTAFVQEMRALPSPTPQHIDACCTQFAAQLKLRLAQASGSSLIRRYVRHGIDLTNIRTSLRNYDESAVSDALLAGGEIPVHQLLGGRANVLSAINRSSLPYELAESIEKLGEDPIALERTCASVLAQDIADMWNIPMSIEPLFAFAAIALSNIFLMRTILIGKANGLPPQEIKKILPPFIPSTHFLS